MKIFLTGATGFIGSHLAEALLSAGHELALATHRIPTVATAGTRAVHADYVRDLESTDWLPRVTGMDVVINAVGILREHGDQNFERLHLRAPQALFAACQQAGVRRVIQISALGADERAASRYHLSKRAADDALANSTLDWTIVQPALVYGPGGGSAGLFMLIASLPLIPLPGRGEQLIQPIHIDDLVSAIVSVIEQRGLRERIPLVGPTPIHYRHFLATLRAAMNLGPARFVSIPMPLMRVAARIGGWMPGAMLDSETLAMLERGNTAPAASTRRLLGREPRAVDSFVSPAEQQSVRLQAQLTWLLPLLRYSLAAMWIFTGIVSLGAYPIEQSYALLARVGATGAFASLLLYGAAALDIVLGLGTVFLKRRRWLWNTQLFLILFYTAIITLKLPEFWLHPYGPVLKNIPILATLLLLQQLERLDGIHRP